MAMVKELTEIPAEMNVKARRAILTNLNPEGIVLILAPPPVSTDLIRGR